MWVGLNRFMPSTDFELDNVRIESSYCYRMTYEGNLPYIYVLMCTLWILVLQ